ncbi:MAG TPA: PKD domain-containing protein [bacterium]|nr:PKD domain-containing protein [bacterium]
MDRRLIRIVATLALLAGAPACGTQTQSGASANPTPTPSNNGIQVSAVASTTSGMAPLNINFTAVAAGASGNVSWKWDFGDGASATTKDAAHTYQTNGTFVATVKATDTANHSGTATVTITVGQRTAPAVTASADHTSGLAPLTVNFTSTVTGGAAPVTLAWDFGDGANSTDANPQHIFQTAGSFSAKVTAKDSTGATASATVLIQVGATNKPVVSITANPTSGAAPLPVAFTSQASGGNGTLTYAWDFGDGATATTANANHTYNANGNYAAKLTVKDASNNTAMASVTIVVSQASASMPNLTVANLDAYGTGLSDAYEPNDTQLDAFYLGAGPNTFTVNDGYLDTLDVTFYADVVNNGAAITSPFYVDFYANRDTAPADGDYGDDYQQVTSLDANATTRLYFTVPNVDPTVATTSWIKADSLSEIDEADETDNDSYGLNVTVTPDEDWFSVYEDSGFTLSISLTNLPADYDLELYDSNGTKVASSANAGTTAESISYTATATDYYYVRVVGYQGARSSSAPYNLKIVAP